MIPRGLTNYLSIASAVAGLLLVAAPPAYVNRYMIVDAGPGTLVARGLLRI